MGTRDRVTTHPNRRARQERALDRRQKQLAKGHYETTYTHTHGHTATYIGAVNKEAAEQEIAALKQKLGVS